MFTNGKAERFIQSALRERVHALEHRIRRMSALRRIMEGSAGCRGLLLSDVLLLVGQMVGYVAVPWWIAANGGAHDLSIYASVVAVGTLICSPLLAPFGDHWPKRAQIICATAVLALASAALAVIAWAGRYDLPLLVGVALVAVIATSVLQPASATIAAEIVDSDRLPSVLSLQKAAQALGRIGGPLVSGALIALFGVSAALAAVPLLLGIATIAALGIPRPRSAPSTSTRRERWLSSLRMGFAAKWAVPLERGWTLVNFLVWIFLGPAVTLLIPLKVQSLGLSGAWLGGAEAALSVGMMLGAVGGPERLVRRIGRFNARTGAAMSQGLFLAVAATATSPVVLLAALLCTGFGNSMLVLVGQTHRTLAIPREFRVRMTAVNQMATQIASALGPALVALCLRHAELPVVYLTFALAAALCSAAFYLLPRAAEFLSLDHEGVRDWYGREYPQAFGRQANGSMVRALADVPALPKAGH